MKLTRLAHVSIALIGLACLTETAQAYQYEVCEARGASKDIKFPSNIATLRLNTTSFPTGGTGGYLTAIDTAITQFNKNPSKFRLSRVYDSGGVAFDNGENEVWGSDDSSILKGSPAIAYIYSECYWLFGIEAKITEGDTIFDYDSPWKWTSSFLKTANMRYAGSLRYIATTALHEFGHIAGLMHENRLYNEMGTDFTHTHTQGGYVIAYFGENAGNGLVALYGLRSESREDVAVAHWRRTGADGEYSSHDRTRLLTLRGIELPYTNVGWEPRYTVTAGSTVTAEFTYENLGKSTQNGNVVRFYISTDETITSADQLIASANLNLTRDVPYTTQHTFNLPGNLRANTEYWLGAIISIRSGATDADSANNASYIRIRVASR